ncbi:hypothetical protein HNP65_000316 [Thermosipho japonicus]|uniref:Phage head morphogenesis domain-containing protein n=1 Tax=Thermosipho japonicus TaxID=90323 RepID=A0A841GL84_9BACT|nr:phage minor head protein [Thermosipho japonicus]MBB6061894.1 hypothetical protein [Thermosipho japonicus]
MNLDKNLNRIERRLIQRNLSLLKQLLERLIGLLMTNEIGTRTLEWLKIQIQQQTESYISEFEKYLNKELLNTFKLSSKLAHSTINQPFSGVPSNAMLWFNENFMSFEHTVMKNYAGDLMRIIENTLTAGIISGTPNDVLAKILIKQIPPTAKRRITVMVRDQVGHAMQQGIWRTYVEYEEVIDKFKWSGPSDSRTTAWCANRKKLTQEEPWTKNEIERYIETNPRKLKGLEIRADHGTFLHPHIQCRHRLLALPKPAKLIGNQFLNQ